MSREAGHAAVYEFKPFPHSSHDRILKQLAREKSPLQILDVGTASGYLGKTLSASGHHVTGIEMDEITAEKARGYYERFFVADIENFTFPFREEFDYILFADVLEHLRDPVAVLRRCLPGLKNSGKVIISLPNVANVVVRVSLLFGRFDYMERGILDRTHLRFFTLRSLKQMLGEAGCTALEVLPTPLPVQLVLPFTESGIFAPLHETLYLFTRLWKTGLAYQFVTIAAPSHPGAAVEHSDETLAAEVTTKA